MYVKTSAVSSIKAIDNISPIIFGLPILFLFWANDILSLILVVSHWTTMTTQIGDWLFYSITKVVFSMSVPLPV